VNRLKSSTIVCVVVCAVSPLGTSGCSDTTLIIAEYKRPNAHDAGSSGASSDSGMGGAGGEAGGALGLAGAGVGPREGAIAIANAAREVFCADHGPALRSVTKPSAGEAAPVCTAGIGRRLFSYALCTCGDMTLSGSLATIDSFDSRQGPYKTAETGSAIGCNGSLQDQAGFPSSIAGTVIVAGSMFQLAAFMSFGGDVKVNTSIDLPTVGVGFDRDLWVNGDIRGVVGAPVGRDVHQSLGYTGADMLSLKGMLYREPVSVNTPCPCEDESLLDIRGLVAAAQADNDNAALLVPPAALGAMTMSMDAGALQTGFTCGRFATPSLVINSDITSELSGRAALFVDGDLTLNADFGAGLPEGAELDVFVTGELRFSGPGRLGSQARPSALRLYVGGSNSLTITSANPIAAQIYAPHTPVLVDSSLAAVFGSIFAAQLETRGIFGLHYDRAIIDAGEGCTSPSPTPAALLCAASCQPCPNGLAAVSGACGACARDADCCEPLVCADGACQPLILPRQ
jgi:hypothetical protein